MNCLVNRQLMIREGENLLCTFNIVLSTARHDTIQWTALNWDLIFNFQLLLHHQQRNWLHTMHGKAWFFHLLWSVWRQFQMYECVVFECLAKSNYRMGKHRWMCSITNERTMWFIGLPPRFRNIICNVCCLYFKYIFLFVWCVVLVFMLCEWPRIRDPFLGNKHSSTMQ